MKTRTEFVSNSSSTSAVVAVNSSYSVEDFAYDMAKNLSSRRRYSRKTADINRTTIEFCLSRFELLFLGSWTLSVKEKLMTLQKSIDIHGKKYGKFEFKLMADAVEKRKKSGKSAADGRIDYIDEDGAIHWFVDQAVDSLPVSTTAMDFFFPLKASAAEVYKNLKKIAEDQIKNNDLQLFLSNDVPEIYQITERTIRNTEVLIKNKADVKLDEWEDISSLKKRLKSGEKIFAMTISYDNCPFSVYSVYSDNAGISSWSNIAAEIIHGE